MSDIVLAKNTYKYLKIIYKEYINKIHNNSEQPDYFDSTYFNEKSKKINNHIANNAKNSLIECNFLKPYTDGAFKLKDTGIVYIETHCFSYLFKKWIIQHIIPIISLFISLLSFLLSVTSLLVGLQK